MALSQPQQQLQWTEPLPSQTASSFRRPESSHYQVLASWRFQRIGKSQLQMLESSRQERNRQELIGGYCFRSPTQSTKAQQKLLPKVSTHASSTHSPETYLFRCPAQA
jgi:hypothetical protein